MKLCKQYYITGIILLIIAAILWFITKDIIVCSFALIPSFIAITTASINHYSIKKDYDKRESAKMHQKSSEDFKKMVEELKDETVYDNEN